MYPPRRAGERRRRKRCRASPGEGKRKTTFLARVTETVSYEIDFHGHGGIIARGTEKVR